jgi:hypothetical protein
MRYRNPKKRSRDDFEQEREALVQKKGLDAIA